MVTLMRTIDVNGIDKQLEAREWGKKAAEYVEGRFGFSSVRVGLEVYGQAGRLHFTGRQDSLESLARGTLEALADEGYRELVTKYAHLVVPGSTHDTVVLDL